MQLVDVNILKQQVNKMEFNKKVFTTKRAQNGQSGFTVTVPADFAEKELGQGVLSSMGKAGQLDLYDFVPDKKVECFYKIFDREVIPVVGAVIVKEYYLQNFGSHATIVAMGPMAVIKTLGYKGRTSSLTCYVNGEVTSIPVEILIAGGLVPPTKPVEEIKPEIPAVPTAFAEALKKAGIVK